MNFQAAVTGLWMVLLALCFRLVLLWPADTPFTRVIHRTLSIAGQCLSVPSVRAETASQRVRLPEKPPKRARMEPADEPEAPFTSQEAEAIAIGGSAAGALDKTSLLLTPLTMPADSEPLVLIVHTHTSEAYTPETDGEYEPTGEFRTLDPAHSVVRAGEALAGELRRLGVGVIHDCTVNDDPDYNSAYENSYAAIAAQLEAHPSLRIVLDVHRDAVSGTFDGALQADGEDCARLMLVVGTDAGGLYHPNWQQNLSFALKLQAMLNRRAPGLCRDISVRAARYNQNLTPCSVLVELGATSNTLREVLPTARHLAGALAELIGMYSEQTLA